MSTRKNTEDTIMGQLTKHNSAHSALWNAVAHIGEQLGLQFNEKGEVVGRTQNEQAADPHEEPKQANSPIDKESLKQTVKEALEEGYLKVIVQQPEATTNQPEYGTVNQQVLDECKGKWDSVIGGYCNQIKDACGTAADGKKEKPIFEEKVVRKLLKIHAFIGKILRWFYQDMFSSLKKFAAYEIAIICVLFGGYQYYMNQKLSTEVKKTEIVRFVLSGEPSIKAIMENIDTLIDERGVDEVYKQIPIPSSK